MAVTPGIYRVVGSLALLVSVIVPVPAAAHAAEPAAAPAAEPAAAAPVDIVLPGTRVTIREDAKDALRVTSYSFGKIASKGINGEAGFTALTNLGMTTGGAVSGSTLAGAISSFGAALTTGGAVNVAINNTLTAMNNLGSYSKYVDSQINFNKAKMDAQEAGMGALIDADLAKESARLQSLQIRQQLGSQALGIANQAPQVLLSLFR